MARLRLLTSAPTGVPPLTLLFLGLASLSVGGVGYLGRPVDSPGPGQIRIPPGATTRQIGRQLERDGVVRSAVLFAWLARLQGLDHRLQAGTYQLDRPGSTLAVIDALLEAPVRPRRVTIPERLTRWETAGRLARLGVVDSSRFVALTEEPEFIGGLGIPAQTLEGYLFPETYLFGDEATEEDGIEQLVRQFREAFGDSLRLRPARDRHPRLADRARSGR